MPNLSDDMLVVTTLGHLASDGLDDIFRPPLLNQGIEISAFQSVRFIRDLRRSVKKFLQSPSDQGFSPVLRLKVPKTRHAYRHAALIDIVDLAKYTSLVRRIAPTIESHRVPRDLDMVFSSRFVQGIPFIEKTLGYDRFRAKSHELSNSGQYTVKVVTDISNFYDRLNLHRLESALTDIGCHPGCVKALNEILMHWANRNSYGIPVGCDASRLLAEAMLISVDDQLIASKVPFVRYVDDYRLFATSYMEAHSHLNVLINALDREGLFINSEKTKIISCAGTHQGEDEQEHVGAPAKEFDAIDADERVPVARRISDGYRTRISIFYREPGKDAIAKLEKMDIDEVLSSDDGDDVEEDKLRLFVKVFIYGKDHDPVKLGTFVRRRIHMLGYVVSALIKESGRLSEDVRHSLAADFEVLYSELDQTDYYRICIARLLSSDEYYRPGVFGRWFGRLSVHANPLFTRELILFFRGKISRSEMRQLVEYSHNAHMSVRRAIVAVALECSALKGERGAWAKVWRNASSDIYVLSQCRDFLLGPELPDRP